MTTGVFNVTPAAASHLVVISEPPLRVGVNHAFGLRVAVEDSFGNVETTYLGRVTVALAGGPGGSTSVVLSPFVNQGVATFSNLTLNQIGIGYSLKVASNDGARPHQDQPLQRCTGPKFGEERGAVPASSRPPS